MRWPSIPSSEMLEKNISASFCSLTSEPSRYPRYRDSPGVTSDSGSEITVYTFSVDGLVTASMPRKSSVRTEILKPSLCQLFNFVIAPWLPRVSPCPAGVSDAAKAILVIVQNQALRATIEWNPARSVISGKGRSYHTLPCGGRNIIARETITNRRILS